MYSEYRALDVNINCFNPTLLQLMFRFIDFPMGQCCSIVLFLYLCTLQPYWNLAIC